MRRVICFVALALAATVVVLAGPAAACGGLVGENGTIQLTRTSTLAAYHDGVERYVTSFEFSGTGESVGSIVPLPGIPTKVERGGDWTLQRLQREIAPPLLGAHRRSPPTPQARPVRPRCCSRRRSTRSTSPSCAVVATRSASGRSTTGSCSRPTRPRSSTSTRTARRSSWPRASTRLAPRRSGSSRATARRSCSPSRPSEPWVPLRILALGLDSSQFVNADVFLLTDQRPDGPRRRHRRRGRAQRAGVGIAARRPALRQAHGLGARVDVVHLLRRVDPGRRAAARPRGVDARRHAAVGADGRLLGAGVVRRGRRLVDPGAPRRRRRWCWWRAVPSLRAAASVVSRVVRAPPAGRDDGRGGAGRAGRRSASSWPARVRAVRRPPTACSGPAR